ncbi:DNA-binding protein [Oscillospiraceae bacterium]|nr:DNA-binding protein [Oscillospiraceae bacterium]
MQKSVEFTGKNEDAAIAAALQQLGLAREEVSVEVLELAKSGFLGIGGTPAKVKVTYEVPDEPQAAPQPAPAPAAQEEAHASAAPAEEPCRPVEAACPAAAEGDERAEKIKSFLSGLLERMEIQADPQVKVDAEGNYLVDLVGEDLGAVIGRRGETLDAIQQLTGYAVNHGQAKRVRVRVDAEHYRSKREESLERMAHRVADKVVRYRRNVTLEPMNAYERHVIHTALQDRPDVTTYSIGTEPNRRTVVAYSQGERRD